MTFKSNLSELKSYIKNKVPEGNRTKIEQIIKLYEDKKIVNFKTALNATKLLASTNKNTIKASNADKTYNTIVDKNGEAQPMTRRFKNSYKESKASIIKKNAKKYLLDVILYIKNTTSDEPSPNYTEEVRRHKKRAKAFGVRYNDALLQIFAGQIDVDIEDMMNDAHYDDINHNGKRSFWSIIQHHKTVINFSTKYTGRLLTIDKDAKLTEITDDDERDFEDMAFILMTDPNMKSSWERFGEII